MPTETSISSAQTSSTSHHTQEAHIIHPQTHTPDYSGISASEPSSSNQPNSPNFHHEQQQQQESNSSSFLTVLSRPLYSSQFAIALLSEVLTLLDARAVIDVIVLLFAPKSLIDAMESRVLITGTKAANTLIALLLDECGQYRHDFGSATRFRLCALTKYQMFVDHLNGYRVVDQDGVPTEELSALQRIDSFVPYSRLNTLVQNTRQKILGVKFRTIEAVLGNSANK